MAILLLCSSCHQTVPVNDAHVLPHWNAEFADVFKTYRCKTCWPTSLDKAEASLTALEESVRFRFVEFFRRHDFEEGADALEQATLSDAQTMLSNFFVGLRSGAIVLAP